MVYVVIILWVVFGIIISVYQPKSPSGELLDKVSFASMAIYFVSLTGFIGAFIYGATVKPDHEATPLFLKGRTDKREILIYICIFLWAALGLWGIFKNVPLDEIGAYFGALTPFVGGYILGETARSSRKNDELEKTEE